jgi:GTP-binding protein HflX
VVEDVLEDLDLGDRPQVLIFNKIDRLTHAEEEALSRRIRAFNTTPAVFLSALRPDTFEPIRTLFKARIRAGLRHLSVRVGAGDGETLAMLYREGEVLNQSQHGDVLELEIRVPLSFAGRLLQRLGVELARDHELPA